MMSSSPSTSTKQRKERKQGCFLVFLRVVAHGMIMLGPLLIAGMLHESDSMIRLVPSASSSSAGGGGAITEGEEQDRSNGMMMIAEIGFSLGGFGTNGTHDIEFSHEQEETFGDRYHDAHAAYDVLFTIMWISLIVPLTLGLCKKFCCCCCGERKTWKDVAACLARAYATVTTPVLAACGLLMLVPFFLLRHSTLCGPSYTELQYQRSEYYGYDEEQGCGGPEYEGTIALLREGVPSTCKIGGSGVIFIVLTVIYPCVLLLHAALLWRTANNIEHDVASDRAKAALKEEYDHSDAPEVIKVADIVGHDDGDEKTETDDSIAKEYEP